MSSRKNVSGGVCITIMILATFHAEPFSYSQLFQPARTAARTARRTGYGGIRFIDFLEQYARVIAFILEHCSERCPSGIKHGFRHACFCQTGSVHVTNEDRTISGNQIGAEFVQKIFPAIGNLRMDRLDAGFFVGALRRRQLDFRTAIQAPGFDLGTVRHGCKIFQAKVDANRGGACRLHCFSFNTDIGVPTPARVLVKTA